MQLKLYYDMQNCCEEFWEWNNKLIKDFETIVVKQANSAAFKIDSSLVIKIIVKLIIVVDLQINQCKVSVHLLMFSLLIKVQSLKSDNF